MKKLPENAIIYRPEEGMEITGAVQIVHGMTEHQLRYSHFAKYLASNGIIVVTSDLRGHGENVNREEELGYFGDNAAANLVGDVHEITLCIKNEFPDVPYFIYAHSMGTLVSTTYLKKYDSFLDGIFLSGMPCKNSAAGLGIKLVNILSTFNGEYYRSDFVDSIVIGAFAGKFKREGSPYAWLSTDPEVWKKYDEDPKCGFVFTLNGYKTLLELMQSAHKYGSWAMKNPDMPVRLFAGSDDPCAGGKRKFSKTVKMFKQAGYTNIESTLFEGFRHELHNEPVKDELFAYVVKEIKQCSNKALKSPEQAH